MLRSVLSAVAALLLLPAAAFAKEVSQIEVCGVSGCKTVTDHAALARFGGGGGTPGAPPPVPGEYYRLTVTVAAGPGASFAGGRHSATWSAYYVPGAQVMRPTQENSIGEWQALSSRGARALDQAAAGTQPFPTPRLTMALIGSKRARNPQSYAKLYDVQSIGPAVPGKSDWLTISLRSKQPSPWTDGLSTLQYSPSAKVLQRDAEFIRVPDEMAARIAVGQSLAPPGSGGFPWLITCLAGVTLIALAALALAARRLRPRLFAGRPEPA